MYATNVLKFAHYSCILLNYIQTCLVYRDRLKKKKKKKMSLPFDNTRNKKKKKTKNIALQIIGTIIEIENYIHNTVSRFSLDKYFPLEKNIENP